MRVFLGEKNSQGREREKEKESKKERKIRVVFFLPKGSWALLRPFMAFPHLQGFLHSKKKMKRVELKKPMVVVSCDVLKTVSLDRHGACCSFLGCEPHSSLGFDKALSKQTGEARNFGRK